MFRNFFQEQGASGLETKLDIPAIGSTAGLLLEINKQALGLIEANLVSFGTLNLLQGKSCCF